MTFIFTMIVLTLCFGWKFAIGGAVVAQILMMLFAAHNKGDLG